MFVAVLGTVVEKQNEAGQVSLFIYTGPSYGSTDFRPTETHVTADDDGQW